MTTTTTMYMLSCLWYRTHQLMYFFTLRDDYFNKKLLTFDSIWKTSDSDVETVHSVLEAHGLIQYWIINVGEMLLMVLTWWLPTKSCPWYSELNT